MPSRHLTLLVHAATSATRRAAFATGEEAPDACDPAVVASLRDAPAAADTRLVSPAATARRTAEALGLEAAICPALRDLDAGSWAGRTLAQIAPGEAAAWLADPGYDGHGGESLVALIERMARFLDERLAERGSTLALTHAAPARAALVAVLGAPAAAFWRIESPPLSVLVLGSDGRRWALRGLGRLADGVETKARGAAQP